MSRPSNSTGFESYVKQHTNKTLPKMLITFETYVKRSTSKTNVETLELHRVWDLCKTRCLQTYPMTFVLFETYVKLSTSNRIWNIRSIRVWVLCQTSFSGYPVPLRAFELLNLVNSQPFSLIQEAIYLFIIGIIASLFLFATVVCVTAVIAAGQADYNKATRRD